MLRYPDRKKVFHPDQKGAMVCKLLASCFYISAAERDVVGGGNGQPYGVPLPSSKVILSPFTLHLLIIIFL